MDTEREHRKAAEKDDAITARTLLRDLQGCTSEEERVEMLADALAAPPPSDRDVETARELIARNYDEETDLEDGWFEQFTNDIAAALAAARRDERETGIAEERARWRPDDAPDREPTEFEVGLWERILAGMLEDDKGFVSSAHPAFRAWCLTVIKPYTDAIVKAAREEGRGDAEARVAALEGGINKAVDEMNIAIEDHESCVGLVGIADYIEARDALAALVKAEEVERNGGRK